MKTAQKAAKMPMSATALSPSNGFLKSNKVMLNTINPKAITINMVVNIFIVRYYRAKVKKNKLHEKPFNISCK